MVFKAIEERKELPSYPTPIIISRENSPIQQELSIKLEAHFQQNGYSECTRMSLEQASNFDGLTSSFCISLLEIDEPALRGINEPDYHTLQKLIASGAKWLWVSRLGDSNEPPSQGIMEGLSRVLLAEDPTLVFVLLALQSAQADACLGHIDTVSRATLLGAADHSFELEYREKDSLLFCKRIVQEPFLDRHISRQVSPKQTTAFELLQGPPLTIDVASPGLLDSIRLVEDDKAEVQLGRDQIEVEVRAIGLNFMDLLTALGRLGEKSVMGTECAGVVSRIGSEAKGNLKIGDRVVVTYVDLFKTYVRCPYQSAVVIPDNLAFTDAASIPTTFTTAYHSLLKVAHLKAGETILIHSAAGATGQSAVQIARHVGAEIFATVGSDTKKKFLMESYNIPEDHIFFSRNTSFAQGIRRMTKNKGVDVVLNSLSGEGLIASWECIAAYGRFIEIGKKDIHAGEKLPMLPFAKNVTFSAVDMADMTKERPPYMHELLTMLVQMLGHGTITPPKPVQVYKLAEIEHAFRHMQSGQSTGKMVIEIDRHAMVQVCNFLH
jgi:NADPH:quinone reductase-like Zn-dependent oxidoreductase